MSSTIFFPNNKKKSIKKISDRLLVFETLKVLHEHQVNEFNSEVDLGLLQHPRWSTL